MPRRSAAFLSLLLALGCRGAEEPAVAPPTTQAAVVPASTLAPPPSTTLAPVSPKATPSPTRVATPAPPPSSTLAPTPAPVATPAVDLAKVASLVGEGEAALLHDKLPEATAFFNEALALDPTDARARKGRARAATAARGLARTFVPDLSSADGAEGRVKEMEGFDVDEVDVRQAARIPGRTELEAQPKRIKPGDTYTVKVYLRNQSRKKKRVIKINGLEVRKVVNGVETPFPATLLQREVAPKERVLVATLTGPWDDDVASFTLDVRVSSEVGDLYQNRLFWK